MGEHVDVGLWQGFGVLVYGNVNLLGGFGLVPSQNYQGGGATIPWTGSPNLQPPP